MVCVKVVTGSLIAVSICCIIVIPIILLLPSDQDFDMVVAYVKEGMVVGIATSEAAIFYGVPFSQPPTGDFRWKRPRDPLPYSTAYWNATFKRPGCYQICDQPASEYSCPHTIDEDCLYLNVWLPRRLLINAKPSNHISGKHYEVNPDFMEGGLEDSLPVMVWFYGGNFLNGAGSCVLYDGRFMADRGDVIIVTTNYRVAHFGFLVQGQGEEESKGNFGFWDQVKTLEWVQENIANFGGNPQKVTIFGQSAGAESVGVHLISDNSSHLFQRAIMQSNPFGLPFRNLTDAKEFGNRFTQAAGCVEDDMKCMRSKTTAELEAAFNDTSLEVTDPSKLTLIFQQWGPVIDWDIVPGQPVDLFVAGKAQKKPMILGATVDEGMIFVAEAFPTSMNRLRYKALLKAVFKQDYQNVIERYPPAECEECDNRYMLNKLATEYLFQCPQRKVLNITSGEGKWWYIFNQTWSFYEVWEEPLCYEHVCHAAELAYLFNVENLTHYTYTDHERELSRRMLYLWSNFATTGNPNEEKAVQGGVVWPKFQAYQGGYESLKMTADGDEVLSEPYKEICDFWDDEDAYADHFMNL